jgi:hypothetical protein
MNAGVSHPALEIGRPLNRSSQPEMCKTQERDREEYWCDWKTDQDMPDNVRREQTLTFKIKVYLLPSWRVLRGDGLMWHHK